VRSVAKDHVQELMEQHGLPFGRKFDPAEFVRRTDAVAALETVERSAHELGAFEADIRLTPEQEQENKDAIGAAYKLVRGDE
jgi:hypothetical protein